MTEQTQEKSLDKKGGDVMSYSRMMTYLGCPRKYEYKYFKSEDVFISSLPLEYGSSIHEAIEADDLHLKEHGKRLGLRKLKKFFVERLKKNTRGIYEKNTIRMGKGSLRAYRKILDKQGFIPEAIEQKINIEFSMVPVKLTGAIDCIAQDGTIIDRKTSGKKFDANMEKKMQLFLYAAWYRKTYKKKEKGLRFDVLRKTMKPNIEIIELEYTEKDIQDTIGLLGWVHDRILARDFPKKTSFACKWCEFKDDCLGKE